MTGFMFVICLFFTSYLLALIININREQSRQGRIIRLSLSLLLCATIFIIWFFVNSVINHQP